MASKTEKQVWETFVRRSGELKEGDALTFEVANGEKGPSAVNVSRA